MIIKRKIIIGNLFSDSLFFEYDVKRDILLMCHDDCCDSIFKNLINEKNIPAAIAESSKTDFINLFINASKTKSEGKMFLDIINFGKPHKYFTKYASVYNRNKIITHVYAACSESE